MACCVAIIATQSYLTVVTGHLLGHSNVPDLLEFGSIATFWQDRSQLQLKPVSGQPAPATLRDTCRPNVGGTR